MSDRVPEEGIVLSVGYDLAGAQQFVEGAEATIPPALQRLAAMINGTELGSTAVFRDKGLALGRAYVEGMRLAMQGATSLDPASYALTSVGGDALTRQLQGRTTAALEFTRAMSQLNEVTARAQALGILRTGPQPAAIAQGPAATSVANVSARTSDDASRTARFEDRLERVVAAIERRTNSEAQLRYAPTGQLQVEAFQQRRQSLEGGVPSERDLRALRREAIDAAREVNEEVIRRRGRTNFGGFELQPETVRERLNQGQYTQFITGGTPLGAVVNKLSEEVRAALYSPGSLTIDRFPGNRGVSAPQGFTTPQAQFGRLFNERFAGEPFGYLSDRSHETEQAEARAAQQAVAARQELARQVRESTEREQRVSRNLIEAQERLARAAAARAAQLEADNARLRQVGVPPAQPAALPRGDDLVRVVRAMNEPLDLARIGPEGARFTTQLDYARQHGNYLYETQVPRSQFRNSELRELQGLGPEPHLRLSREQAARATLIEAPYGGGDPYGPTAAPRPPAPPRLPRTVDDQAALVANMRAAGLDDDQVVSGLENLGYKARDARAWSPTCPRPCRPSAGALAGPMTASRPSSPVGTTPRPAAPVLGASSTRATCAPSKAPSRFRRTCPRPSTPAICAGGWPRLARSSTSCPPSCRPHSKQVRERPAGCPVVSSPVAVARSVAAVAVAVPSAVAGGFGAAGDDDDLDDLLRRARERSRFRRAAREEAEGPGPSFAGAQDEEGGRRAEQERRDSFRQTRERMARERAHEQASRENYRRNIEGDGVFGGLLTSLRGPSGSFRKEFMSGFRGRDDNLGAGLGQAAKFSVLYGSAYAALFQVTQAFQASAAAKRSRSKTPSSRSHHHRADPQRERGPRRVPRRSCCRRRARPVRRCRRRRTVHRPVRARPSRPAHPGTRRPDRC
jgi:hypothetical protein